jgi:hypothetical protein
MYKGPREEVLPQELSIVHMYNLMYKVHEGKQRRQKNVKRNKKSHLRKNRAFRPSPHDSLEGAGDFMHFHLQSVSEVEDESHLDIGVGIGGMHHGGGRDVSGIRHGNDEA